MCVIAILLTHLGCRNQKCGLGKTGSMMQMAIACVDTSMTDSLQDVHTVDQYNLFIGAYGLQKNALSIPMQQ